MIIRDEVKEVAAILRKVWLGSLLMSVVIVVVIDTRLVSIRGVSPGSTWPMWVAIGAFWAVLLALTVLGFVWRRWDPRWH